MNIFEHINYLAVLVGTVLYFLLGALWYSKMLFGTQWGQLHNVDFNDMSAKSRMGTVMGLSFVMMLISVFGLAVLIHHMGITTTMGGLKVGLLCGVCFSAATIAITNVYLNKKMPLYFIDGAYHVIGYVIASLVLAMWH